MIGMKVGEQNFFDLGNANGSPYELTLGAFPTINEKALPSSLQQGSRQAPRGSRYGPRCTQKRQG
jgi:hypothetical protein